MKILITGQINQGHTLVLGTCKPNGNGYSHFSKPNRNNILLGMDIGLFD